MSENGSSGSSSSAHSSDYEMVAPEGDMGAGPDTSLPVNGKPIQIVKVTEDRSFELDVEALSGILLKDVIRDKPVVVVSIAGDFRKGKSFMLNHFLQYLQSHYGGPQEEQQQKQWLADLNEQLEGFSWRGGSKRDTTGILMWSQPFVVKGDDGQEVAIVLMDTQGAFDSEYTVRDSATVFALSTMTSSIQVFNLMHNLQEDNLQVLEIFLEYGRLALESVHEKPFQKLIFLIRDWSFPYEHSYGFEGGEQLLTDKLRLKETMPEQLQRVRRKIRDCFNELGCFLMPHPGPKVATNPNFKGAPIDYDQDFLEQLKLFVPDLLKPSKLVVKEIGGRKVTGRELLEYFKVYINVFAGDTMPEPKTMLEATAEANNLTAVALVKDSYVQSMEAICGGNMPYVNPNTLDLSHVNTRAECMDKFDKIPKMGGAEFSIAYRQKLEEELDMAYEHFAVANKNKNVFSLFGAPLLLVGACVLCIILSRVFELVGIAPLANLFSAISTLDLALLVAYVFARYSGNHPDFVAKVDEYSEMMWLYVTGAILTNLTLPQVVEQQRR